MPSDVFWTGLFTLGGGFAGAATGYASARLQSKGQERQVQLAHQRHQSQEARATETRRDTQREERRSIYLGYLQSLDAILNSTTAETVSQETLSDRWGQFMQADNEVELAGDEKIKESSYPIHAQVSKTLEYFSEILDKPDLTWPDDASAYLRSMQDDLLGPRRKIISLMRDDLRRDLQ
jgi:hypothetical protein